MAGGPLFSIVRTLLTNSCRSLPNRFAGIYSLSHHAVHDDKGTKIPPPVPIPPAPHRPVMPYIKFFKDIYPFVRSNMTGSKLSDITKHIAEEWKQLKPEEKKKYLETYEAEKAKYLKEEEKWRNTLTPDQKSALEETKAEQRLLKVRKKKRKARKELEKVMKSLGKPKRPPSSFVLYCQTRKSADDKGLKGQPARKRSLFSWLGKKSEETSIATVNWQNVMKSAGEEWRKMTNEEKLPYVEQALKENANYKAKLAEWQQKMDAEGKMDHIGEKTVKKERKARKKTVHAHKRTVRAHKQNEKAKTVKRKAKAKIAEE